MTLTKNHLIDSIARNGHSKKKAERILEKLLEHIKTTLSTGEDVLISGFGKFCVKKKRERRGRNPATGDDLILDARKVVTFNCSGTLKDKLK